MQSCVSCGHSVFGFDVRNGKALERLCSSCYENAALYNKGLSPAQKARRNRAVRGYLDLFPQCEICGRRSNRIDRSLEGKIQGALCHSCLVLISLHGRDADDLDLVARETNRPLLGEAASYCRRTFVPDGIIDRIVKKEADDRAWREDQKRWRENGLDEDYSA